MDPNNLNNTPDTTGQFDPNDIAQNKTTALLSYIGFLFLVPLLSAKDSAFARFHANQGIVLFILEIVSGILVFIPIIGGIISLVVWLVALVFAILGIVNAANGRAKQLPLIGGITILK